MPIKTFARPVIRFACCLVALALVSACATKPPVTAQVESGQYRARAGRTYTPPGPASDPWGPYVAEAAAKYDVPERWIREVMRQESGGRLYGRNGDLITSSAGAMGLMQVMPATYDELRRRYTELGPDAFDPHNNIMAGTAYIREMYDIYGSPGFLAAYNAGPGRLDDYLTRNRSLPEETRRYVANIGPRIAGSEPRTASPGAQYAMNAMPFNVPSGSRYPAASVYTAPAGPPVTLNPAPIQVAQVAPPARTPYIVLRPVEVAQLPEPPPPVAPPAPIQLAQMPEPPRAPPAPVYAARESRSQQTLASAALVPMAPRGFGLVSQANAAPIGGRRPPAASGYSAGGWAVQVGAFANEGLAASATTAARDQARDVLGPTRAQVSAVRQPHGTLFRARLTGLSRDAATHACERLVRTRTTCFIVSPDAQL